ncbi:MAG: alpha/beta hydrolase [Bradyrhizobium sp.]|nr:alpha/beta hydrolase [Bradyrhizobium sp.]
MQKFALERRRVLQLLAAAGGGAVALPATAKQVTGFAGSGRSRGNEAALQTHYRTVTVDGLELFYREAGPADAPVVLLLHGWPTSSRMFRNLIPKLAARYRVLAPDYPGFGHSAVPDRASYQYTFDHLGDSIEGFVQKLGVRSFVLYNMDFGGPVGYRLMLKKPFRMTALVVQNGPAYPEDGSGWWEPLARYWKDGSDANRQKVRDYLSKESIKQQYLHGVRDPSRIDPDTWLVDHALIARPGLDDVSLDLLYDIRNNGPVFAAAREYFRANQPPTLIVSGANDEIFPAENQRKYLADLPKAETHLVDSGHFALEDKGDEIAALMSHFLDRTVPR